MVAAADESSIARANCHGTHTRRYLLKKNPTAERKYCQFSEIRNEESYLSNEKFCLKFGRFFAEILQGKYKETLAVESILKFMMFSKLKTEGRVNRQV